MSACGTSLDSVQRQKSKVIFLSKIFITWKAFCLPVLVRLVRAFWASCGSSSAPAGLGHCETFQALPLPC